MGTYNDATTSTNGTASTDFSTEAFASATLNATNTNITYTNGTTLFASAPNAGTNITFTNLYAITTNGSLKVGGGFLEVNSIRSNGSTPGIVSGTGAGTSPTINISGSDMAGIITLTTGTTPTGSATIATITYSTTYKQKPIVILQPANSNAAGLSGLTEEYINDGSSDATKFIITSGATGLTGATAYIWYYHVIQ